MRSFILAAFVSSALAVWNPKICNGSGGCTGTTWNHPDPFRCEDGSLLNLPQGASNEQAAGGGDYEIVSKDEFPSVCLQDKKPGALDTLVKHRTEFGQTMYLYIAETCTEKNPVADCYSQTPNQSSYTLCTLVDSNKKPCTMNPAAGECERWGSTAGRTQCIGWTPDKPEPKSI